MPRNETVEMDIQLTLNGTAAVHYNEKGWVDRVTIAEDSSVDLLVFSSDYLVIECGKYTVPLSKTERIAADIATHLNEEMMTNGTKPGE